MNTHRPRGTLNPRAGGASSTPKYTSPQLRGSLQAPVPLFLYDRSGRRIEDMHKKFRLPPFSLPQSSSDHCPLAELPAHADQAPESTWHTDIFSLFLTLASLPSLSPPLLFFFLRRLLTFCFKLSLKHINYKLAIVLSRPTIFHCESLT